MMLHELKPAEGASKASQKRKGPRRRFGQRQDGRLRPQGQKARSGAKKSRF